MTEASASRPLRILVVDDHEVVRQGLVAVLDRRAEFQVVAEAANAAEAIEHARRYQPEIVVMDVRLPDGSGIEACREIRAEVPGTRVVMLTSYPDEEAVLSAIVAGASGYLLKQTRARDLVSALEAVGRGESLLDPAVTHKVLERAPRNVDALILVGTASARLRDFQTAIGDIEKALELSPRDPRAPGAMGVLRQAVGEVAEAENWLTNAVTVAPDQANPVHRARSGAQFARSVHRAASWAAQQGSEDPIGHGVYDRTDGERRAA